MASRAVHAGEVLKAARAHLHCEARAELTWALDRYQRGMFKLFREGSPKDWGALVPGG